jgi:tRNA (mo5U34)-methyltransferase
LTGYDSSAELEQDVASNPLWYHVMDLGSGVVTPGWFDMRPIAAELPWPDLTGKRCLDIGTYDGFLAFEMERRGAAQVVATDVDSHDGWDFPVRARVKGPAYLAEVAGEKGRGFDIAARALGSRVERRFISVYDLDPDEVGTFDVVVCGSLLLHLRDPFRALEAIRRVCRQWFLSIEAVDARLSVLQRRRPAFWLNGDRVQWLLPNVAAHDRMLDLCGFDLVKGMRGMCAFGPRHPPQTVGASALLGRLVAGGKGHPLHASLTRAVSG